jgi:membrane protease YdiL (CAAX protease family)
VSAPLREPTTVRGLLARSFGFVFLTIAFATAAGLLLPAGDLIAQSAALGAAGLLAGWALLHRDGWPAEALGLPLDRRAAREGLLGGLGGIAVAGAAMAGMALVGALDWAADGTSWTFGRWAAEGVRSLVWLGAPAASEEVLLRGYVLAVTARVVGAATALWVTAVAFGLLHAANPEVGALGLAGVTAAGLALGALVLRTGSLWPAIGAHWGWNWALAFLGDVPVSGLDVADAPGFEGLPSGAEWLSGGAFGVEASAIAVVALAAATWWVWSREPVRVAGRPTPMWVHETT